MLNLRVVVSIYEFHTVFPSPQKSDKQKPKKNDDSYKPRFCRDFAGDPGRKNCLDLPKMDPNIILPWNWNSKQACFKWMDEMVKQWMFGDFQPSMLQMDG